MQKFLELIIFPDCETMLFMLTPCKKDIEMLDIVIDKVLKVMVYLTINFYSH